MVIQLSYEVTENKVVPTIIGIVQECDKHNKPVFKGTIFHRNDVVKKMDLRRGQRRYRRKHKRYRPARFNNRGSYLRKGRLAPSIKNKKD